jgi:serine/threonine-protein kinase
VSASVLGDRYRLEARIGAGGMAEVFRALDTKLNRAVAVKILAPQFARDEGFVERFRREARAGARLNHPNVVGVYDSGSEDGTHYIVMEFVEGRTVADFLGRGGRLSTTQAIEIAERVADALASAHAEGVVHRDIKTANIMVTRSGVVKVMDFGIARFTEGSQTIAKTAEVLGTASYLSPEQAQGQTVDARSDIYSLGVVLYEMLTGRPPFSGDSAIVVATKHVQETPAPPSSLNRELSPALDAVVMRALAKNPANRYQTAGEFREDLERVRRGEPVAATPLLATDAPPTQVISRPQATQVMPPAAEPPESPGRRVALGILIGLLILAVLGGGTYLLASSLLAGSEEPTPAPVEVPSVIGETQEDAEQTLTDAGFDVAVELQVNETVDPGYVFGQEPAAGQFLAKGETVTIFVAREPRLVEVPDVTGEEIEDARDILTGEGLAVGSETPQETTEFEPGTVISQEPIAGTEVERGTPVNLVVAVEPAPVTVQSVTCLSFGRARSILERDGLRVALGDPVLPLLECPNPNKVADQDPDAGTQVPPGTVVTLHLGGLEASPS